MIHRHQHLARVVSRACWQESKKLAAETKGINAKTAIIVPAILGSMPFFWCCVVLACVSLPAIGVGLELGLQQSKVDVHLGLATFFPAWLIQASVIAAVAWIAQTFIQLVALPVLQVSNNAQMGQQEAHTAEILQKISDADDRLNLETEGGLKQARDEIIAALKPALPSPAPKSGPGSGRAVE